MRPYILIPYYSASGAVEKLALYIARGVESVGIEGRLRRIPSLKKDNTVGPLLVSKEDIIGCSGMIVGSPTRFGQMASGVRAFWDTTGDVWYNGQLVGRPGAVFTSSASLHGGQESTLLGMMMPMIHHGMIIVGIPYTEKAIHDTKKGGGPYGASSVVSDGCSKNLSKEEMTICHHLGARVAKIAKKLSD